MTQEEKELLLKDLCARLPYVVKCCIKGNYKISGDLVGIVGENISLFSSGCGTFNINVIRPYLFPLSSITEEQKKEISKRYNYHNPYRLCVEITNHSEGYWDDDTSCNLQDYLWLEDWFNKNHFDYRGLIEKGLAIDATNLKVY